MANRRSKKSIFLVRCLINWLVNFFQQVHLDQGFSRASAPSWNMSWTGRTQVLSPKKPRGTSQPLAKYIPREALLNLFLSQLCQLLVISANYLEDIFAEEKMGWLDSWIWIWFTLPYVMLQTSSLRVAISHVPVFLLHCVGQCSNCTLKLLCPQ